MRHDQENRLKFKLNIRIVKKGDLSYFENSVVVGGRQQPHILIGCEVRELPARELRVSKLKLFGLMFVKWLICCISRKERHLDLQFACLVF